MMGDAIKNRIIIALSISSVIFLLLAMASCGGAKKLKTTMDDLNKQKLASWDLEQKFNKVLQEKSSQEDKLKTMAKQLEAQKNELEITKKTLVQEQLINQSLKEELAKLTSPKETTSAGGSK
jgi:Skp family chaperone for outer membrane proteins